MNGRRKNVRYLNTCDGNETYNVRYSLTEEVMSVKAEMI